LSYGGIIVLKNKSEDEPEDILEPVAAGGPKSQNDDEADGDEPQPPEPFEYVEVN